MRTDDNCIFCKIVAGKIPCFKLFEDEHTLAFMDINPGNPGHALAIAKEHWENFAAMPAPLLGPVLATAQRVAKAIESEPSPTASICCRPAGRAPPNPCSISTFTSCRGATATSSR
jgi:diadenosine tetraphosphate (Ap4A) HIT family hydrolase